MIRVEAIEALRGLVGFRQPIDPDYAFLDAGNIQSDSGIYYDDLSKIATVENIIDTSGYQDSLSDAQKNTILDNIKDAVSNDVLTEIFNSKSHIKESNTLFPYEQDYKSTIDLENDLNYIEIKHLKKGITTNINNIILSFNEDATFNVYLYKSTSINPIQTKEVTTSSGEDTKVYLGWNLDDRFTYRLGYKTSEVGTAKPYLRNYELSVMEELSDNICFEYYSANFDGNRLDLSSESSNSDAFGMNIEYSVYIDWTKEIVKNKNLFSRALQLQMALKTANNILTSNNSNINQKISRDNLDKIAYILGNEDRGTGLKGQYRKEINDIKNFFFPVRRIVKTIIG